LTSRLHFAHINQLRGCAALAVVLCHAAVSAEPAGSFEATLE
jgi:peptidoglycan/LPS O-acetylase OafA/YrhL